MKATHEAKQPDRAGGSISPTAIVGGLPWGRIPIEMARSAVCPYVDGPRNDRSGNRGAGVWYFLLGGGPYAARARVDSNE